MRYRPEIDGLRAVAVLPVIAFHAGLPVLAGGFVGVDVFFVISGYLITSILLDDLHRGRFSILTFYERRARRILPALTAVLLACLPFAWAWMTPRQLEDFAQSLAAVSLFLSNAFFWWQTGYFDTAAEMKPLLHTWSLAVEEQFYIVFPPLLWALWVLARRRLALAFWTLGALSLALCLYLASAAPAANFFLAPSRAWELLAGSLCALMLSRAQPRPHGALALLGLALILAGMAFIGEATPFPSAWALLPVAGTALVILFADPANLCGRLLALRPIVGVGLVSYSAYLIHQPLFAFARIRAGMEPAPAVMLGLAVLTLPLAWLSWRYVEAPFRNREAVGRRAIFAGSGVVLAAGLAVGLAGALAQGWPSRFPRSTAFLEASARMPARGPCIFGGSLDVDAAVACLTAAAPEDTVVLLGDFHAGALAGAMQAKAEAAGLNFVRLAHESCFPIPGTLRRPADAVARSCARFMERAYAALEQAPGVPVVVATRWALNLNGTRFDNGEGGAESGDAFDIAVVEGNVGLAEHAAATLRDLAADHPLVLVGPIPEAGWDVAEVVTSRLRLGADKVELSTSAAVYRERNAAALTLLASLASERVEVVDVGAILCDSFLPGRCVNMHDGVSYYTDDDHPSRASALLIAEAVMARLERLVPRREASSD